MKVSIVIPNWNGRNLLEKNLPAVLEIGADEAIVVDDASTDDSVQFLKNNFPKVKVIENKKNLGFSGNVNKGVSHTKGEIVILLNTDVTPSKDLLKYTLLHFEDNNVFGVSFNEEGYSYSIPEIKDGYVGHKPGLKTTTPHETFWISGGSGAFRKSMWNELGGLDTLYSPFYWEDLDLSFRALKKGWKLVWEPRAKVVHKHETTINTKNFKKKYLDYVKERNQLLFHWKNLSARWLLSEHLFGVARRLTKPGYFIVVLLATLRLPQALAERWSAKNKANLTDQDVFSLFT